MASKQRRKIIALYEKHHAVLQTCSEFSIFSAPIIYFLCLYFVVPSKPAVMNNMMVRKTQDLVQPGTTMFGVGNTTCPCSTYVRIITPHPEPPVHSIRPAWRLAHTRQAVSPTRLI